MSRAVSIPTPELTDWISCTTPPVRDGEYEVQHISHKDSVFWRAQFSAADTSWFNVGMRVVMDATMREPEQYRWRGIRQWVLVRRDDPLCGCDVYVKQRSPHVTRFGGLEKAISFPTKEKAEAYRDRGPFADQRRNGIEAVMP